MQERKSRQTFLGESSDSDLSAACVAIIGNCGGGSHVAQQLAHVGIGKLLLVDPDVTEEPNLNRMVGSTPIDATKRRPKTAVLERLVKSINPDVETFTFDSKWQECAEQLRCCDIVFGCVDGFITRHELETYCRRFLIPYIDVGMDVTHFRGRYVVSGQVITSIPGRPCMWCMGFLNRELLGLEAARYGDAGPRPQVIWPNGVLASVAVGNAIHLLTPWSDQQRCAYLEYDGNRQTVSASSRLGHIDTSCRHYPLSQVGDPFWEDGNSGHSLA
jgi:molybdopterin-synthase adenylyltransferase